MAFREKAVLADDAIVRLIIWRWPRARNRWACRGDLKIKPGAMTDDHGGKTLTAVR
jgi:hypothetical protein